MKNMKIKNLSICLILLIIFASGCRKNEQVSWLVGEWVSYEGKDDIEPAIKILDDDGNAVFYDYSPSGKLEEFKGKYKIDGERLIFESQFKGGQYYNELKIDTTHYSIENLSNLRSTDLYTVDFDELVKAKKLGKIYVVPSAYPDEKEDYPHLDKDYSSKRKITVSINNEADFRNYINQKTFVSDDGISFKFQNSENTIYFNGSPVGTLRTTGMNLDLQVFEFKMYSPLNQSTHAFLFISPDKLKDDEGRIYKLK